MISARLVPLSLTAFLMGGCSTILPPARIDLSDTHIYGSRCAASEDAVSQGAKSNEQLELETLTMVTPAYPARAARDAKEGWVVYEIDIDIDGNVVLATPYSSNPKGVFEESGQAAIMKWKYKTNKEIKCYRQVMTWGLEEEIIGLFGTTNDT